MADDYLLENGTDRFLLEDGSGVLLLEVPQEPVRSFDGVDDFITCAIGGLSTQTGGPITIAAIIKKNANGSFQAFVALNTTAAAQLISTGVQSSDLGYTFTGTSDDANGAATPTYTVADGWIIYAMTKASGTVAPRFHKCVLSTGVWTHTSSAETNSDGAAPGGSGQVMFGAKNNIGHFFNGRMALAAIYPTALSDGALEAMSATLQSWIDASPTGLWPLNQASVAIPVEDIVGTSDQTSIVGTTVVTGDAPPNFDWTRPAVVEEVVFFNEDSASPMTVTKPAAFASGQILVLLLTGHGGAVGDFTDVSGWTSIGTGTSGGDAHGKVYAHAYNAGDPASWNFPYSSGADVAAALFRISGADLSLVASLATNSGTLAVASPVSPSVAMAQTNDLLICGTSHSPPGVASNVTVPSGMVDRGQTQVSGNFQALHVASQQLTSGTTTGTRTWTGYTPTGENDYLTWSIAIKSAAVPGGGATEVDVLQAIETDTAQAIGRQKRRTLVVATETDTARPITVQKRITVGTAVEVNTARPIGKQKSKAVATATETDTARPVVKTKSRAVGQAIETDTATALTETKQRAIGQAVENDTARAMVMPKLVAVNRATETNTAQAIGRQKSRTVGQATEADTATALTETKQRAVNRATEADTATALARRKERAVGQATETDTARPLARTKSRLVNRATEADTATAITETKQRAVNQATETDTATALARRKERLVGQAVESDQGRPITSSGIKNIPVNPAIETNTARPIGRAKSKAVNQASETDTARPIAHQWRRTVGQATELDTAQPMGRAKSKTVNRALETNTAQATARRKLALVGQAVEIDTAQPMTVIGGAPAFPPGPWFQPSGTITAANPTGSETNQNPRGGIGSARPTGGISSGGQGGLTDMNPDGDITDRRGE